MTTLATTPLDNTPRDLKQQTAAVLQHLGSKAFDGLLIGLVFIAVACMDRSGLFSAHLKENLSSIPLLVVVLGAICTAVHVINNDRVKPLTRASLLWVDINQQFFTVGLGAYPLISIGAWLAAGSTRGSFPVFATGCVEAIFLFGAVLFGGWWKLQNQPVKLWAKCFAVASVLIGAIIFGMLILDDGGDQLVKSVTDWLDNLQKIK
jgi:hypothetical protein